MPIFLVFLGAYTLSQFYRSFLAVIAPKLAIELGLSATDLGLLSSSWFAAFALAQLPVGAALDTIGPRRTVPCGMLAAAAGALLWAVAAERAHALVAMALIGIGCAPIYMGALYLFGRTFAPARFALLSSWLLAIGSAGSIASTAPLAWLAGGLGWRGAFLVVAGLTLASAISVLLVVRDPPRVTAAGATTSNVAGGVIQVLAIRRLWPLLPLVAFSYAVVIAERGLWIGPYLASVYGLDTQGLGDATFVVAIAMIAGAFAYGPLDGWLGTRKWIVVGGSVIAAAGFLTLALVPGLPLAGAIAVLAALLAGGSTYAVLMAHGRAFMPEALLGRGITLLNFIFMAGTALVQLVSGHIVDAMQAAGQAPVDIYASLHLGFAAALLLGLAFYLSARDVPPARVVPAALLEKA